MAIFCNLNLLKIKKARKKIHLPLEYSTNKVSSSCHKNGPHSLFTYGLQGGSCILLVFCLKYYRTNEIRIQKKLLCMLTELTPYCTEPA